MNHKLVVLLLIVSINTFPIFSINSDLEIKLLRNALQEGASTKEQKSALAHFMNGIALEKKKEADKFREMASINYGGKARSADLRSQSFLEQAKVLDEEARAYETNAAKFDVKHSEKIVQLH